VEDILIRYHRMKGQPTLWLPGADHAGIETQYVFEKKLNKKGKSRFDYSRNEFYKMIWDYVDENSNIMRDQLKNLGASCDWDRFKFTLDSDIVKIVYTTFKNLHNEKLIYRDLALVSYCTHCGTAYSNLEVLHVERTSPFYKIKYGPFVIGTVRPETKFRDTALAVNPKDSRYKDEIGKTYEIMGLLGPTKMKIISDPHVDPEFGTGIMKVTPAHDPHDFEIGKKHNLPVTPIIGMNGRMDFSWFIDDPKNKNSKYLERAKKYHGLKVAKMREVMKEDFETDGLLVDYNPNYKHTIGVCYRCKRPIEPLPLEQWFIKVAPLAKKALRAIENGETKFANKKYEKMATHWLTNLKDWNISRQIVWGIRIPAWKCEKCSEWTITDGAAPKTCKKCKHTKLTRDNDTFDTWFSSGQWPFATLKTTEKGDFEKFYPTTVMETSYDIIPFWVIRMIMFGIYATGEVPFTDVVIHGLVRDREGVKISKSKGNVIDPIVMSDRYGTDALRIALVWGALIGNDIALSEDNIRGMRNFANKIWNAARYVSGMTEIIENGKLNEDQGKLDKELKDDVNRSIETMTKDLDKFKISHAAEWIYHWFWDTFASRYIELSKDGQVSKKALLDALKVHLKLLHPFMPFVTEVVWKQVFSDEKDMLINTSWPDSK